MAEIRLENVGKTYPGGHTAARDLNLTIADGELVVLVGPSGCGKSTVLRMIAGLETPTSGRILIGGTDVTALPPQERNIAMVFQSYALYPHKTVRQNLEFGLSVRGEERRVIAERIQRAAEALELGELLDRKPAQLSGGQRQRVALGRAMVREPVAFLLDEPLSNLDVQLRVQTRVEIARLHRRLEATTVYVTHDQEEAMTLGDRIAVMRDGELQQFAPPMEVFRYPANAFVARFIGSPAMNLIACAVSAKGGSLCLSSPVLARSISVEVEVAMGDSRALIGVRPQDIVLDAPDGADAVGQVELVQPLGSDSLVHLELPAETRLTVTTKTGTEPAIGTRVGIRLSREALRLFDAGSGNRIV